MKYIHCDIFTLKETIISSQPYTDTMSGTTPLIKLKNKYHVKDEPDLSHRSFQWLDTPKQEGASNANNPYRGSLSPTPPPPLPKCKFSLGGRYHVVTWDHRTERESFRNCRQVRPIGVNVGLSFFPFEGCRRFFHRRRPEGWKGAKARNRAKGCVAILTGWWFWGVILLWIFGLCVGKERFFE